MRTPRNAIFDETTVPYPAGRVPLWDDETTVTIDPAEMRLTAEAMMFVDTGLIALPEAHDKKREKRPKVKAKRARKNSGSSRRL